MSEPRIALFEFMPYGAPELKDVAKKYMFRGVLVGSGVWVLVYLLSFAASYASVIATVVPTANLRVAGLGQGATVSTPRP